MVKYIYLIAAGIPSEFSHEFLCCVGGERPAQTRSQGERMRVSWLAGGGSCPLARRFMASWFMGSGPAAVWLWVSHKEMELNTFVSPRNCGELEKTLCEINTKVEIRKWKICFDYQRICSAVPCCCACWDSSARWVCVFFLVSLTKSHPYLLNKMRFWDRVIYLENRVWKNNYRKCTEVSISVLSWAVAVPAHVHTLTLSVLWPLWWGHQYQWQC